MGLPEIRDEQQIKDLVHRLLDPLDDKNVHFFYHARGNEDEWEINLHINNLSYVYSEARKIPVILTVLDEMNSLFDGKESHIDTLDWHGGNLADEQRQVREYSTRVGRDLTGMRSTRLRFNREDHDKSKEQNDQAVLQSREAQVKV